MRNTLEEVCNIKVENKIFIKMKFSIIRNISSCNKATYPLVCMI